MCPALISFPLFPKLSERQDVWQITGGIATFPLASALRRAEENLVLDLNPVQRKS